VTGNAVEGLRDGPLVLSAASRVEFCHLLRVIWLRSGLTLGQAKIKTGISRSQISGLTRKDRSRLPRIRSQVEDLVVACGLSPDEVATVLHLWDRLRQFPTS
jgi:hypothetical protein